MRGWPEEVIAWLRENVPGRTTKQVTEDLSQESRYTLQEADLQRTRQ